MDTFGSLQTNIQYMCHNAFSSFLNVHFCRRNYIYSRTSDNGPSEKRTTSLQRTHSLLRNEITIVIVLKQPPRNGRFSIPDSGQELHYGGRERFAIRTLTSDVLLPISDVRSPGSDVRSPTYDVLSPTLDLRSPFSDGRFPTYYLRLPTSTS